MRLSKCKNEFSSNSTPVRYLQTTQIESFHWAFTKETIEQGSKTFKRISSTFHPTRKKVSFNILERFLKKHPNRYLVGNERYAGRLVLKGTNQQGLNTHLIPAILQSLEHLPNYILDVPSLFEVSLYKIAILLQLFDVISEKY